MTPQEFHDALTGASAGWKIPYYRGILGTMPADLARAVQRSYETGLGHPVQRATGEKQIMTIERGERRRFPIWDFLFVVGSETYRRAFMRAKGEAARKVPFINVVPSPRKRGRK